MPGQSVLDSMPFGSFPFTPPPRDTKIQLCPYVNYCWHQFLLDDRKIKTEKYEILQLFTSPSVGVIEYGSLRKFISSPSSLKWLYKHRFLKNTKSLSNVSQKFSSDSFHFLTSPYSFIAPPPF